jgi:hypothetical protein
MIVMTLALFTAGAGSGCEAADDPRGGDSDTDSDSDGDSDGDSDSDSDSDTDTGPNPYFGDLQGVVQSASGFPISGALVYVTNSDGPEIPDQVYCYTCDDMTGLKWTLSNPDGTWLIEQVPAGDTNIITRKGFFQRQREITVVGNQVQDIPVEKTTLPGEESGDGLDQIPNYAVLLNGWDLPEDMLAKMGLGDLDTSGHLIDGTESFDLFNDSYTSASSVGPSSMLFSGQDFINYYHMIFFPCICSTLNASNYIPMLQAYVSAGGKIYGSCYAGQWPEQPFPDIIDFSGADTGTSPGIVGHYSTNGTINDAEMRDWLTVVAPGQNLDAFPFTGAYIKIDGTAQGYDGHGVLDDGTIGGPVIPTTWVTDVQLYAGSPLTVTFPFDCGKVFYSSYQVVESSPSPTIRPQEWVLIYLFYEVGVCEGTYVPPE